MCPFKVGDLVLWMDSNERSGSHWNGVGPGYKVLAVDYQRERIHVESKQGGKDMGWNFFVLKTPRKPIRNLPAWF